MMCNPSPKTLFIALIASPLALALVACGGRAAPADPGGDWPAYGRTQLGDRHSPLTQITPANVTGLEVAWRYRTGEKGASITSLKATPLVVDGVLYFSTPFGKVIALDPRTGAEIWKRDLGVAGAAPGVSRGVSLWRDARAAAGAPCAARVLAGIYTRLHAFDARTGESCVDFGEGGSVDLTQGLRRRPPEGEPYGLTSPPAIVGERVIVGSWVADDLRTRSASGEVRAFDARTGKLVWSWDPIPQDPSDPAHATWEGAGAHDIGGGNTWAVITADPARDLVFLPTSSANVDYYGGYRLGDNRYTNSVVALRASTGKLLWHFQTVHHDLWNYDNPSSPALVTIQRGGRAVDVVLQATKTGQLFVLDRETGAPVFPVEERPVPASDVPGERTSPTQPFSIALGTPRDIPPECLGGLRYEGPFTPQSLGGTLVIPSEMGGAHWGGTAYDPARGLAIIPTNRLGGTVRLVPRAQVPADLDLNNTLDHPMADTPYAAPAPRSPPGTNPLRCIIASGQAGALGELVAVDLHEGRVAWTVPLGSGEPFPGTGKVEGLPNLGGAITTAAGLTFIAATVDGRLRAFDTATGRELWSGELPAAGATPMSYLGTDGRQYVAVAAGGNIFASPPASVASDEVVAFALPAGGRH